MSLTDPVVTWLDKFLEAGITAIKFGSTVMPRQTTLQFTGSGVSVADDPINSQTVVTVSGGGGGGGGATPPSGIGLWLNAVAGTLAVAASIGTAGQLPFTSVGGAGIGWASFSGDVSLSTSVPGKATVTAINGASVPAAAGLVTGNVLQVAGPSSLTYSPINVGGGSNYVVGVLPTANQAPQSMTGDTTGTTAAVVVTGIRGTSVPAPSGTGTALVWNAGSSGVFSWAAISGSSALTSYGADLTGDATHQWVQSISGSGGAGGGIAVNAGTLTWGAAQSPGLSQGQQANGSNPVDFIISPQAPGSGAATALTGTPGRFVVNIAAPVSTGSDGGLQVRRNGVAFAQLGPFVNAPTQASLYLGNGVAPSVADATNHVIQVVGSANSFSATIFNSATAGSTLYLRVGGAPAARGFVANTDGVQIGSETFSLGGGSGIIGVANRSAVPTTNPIGGVAVYAQAGQLWVYPSSGSPFQISAGAAPTWTAHAVVLGTGTTATSSVGPGAAGIPLVGGISFGDPVFGTASVPGGGTGATSLAAHGVLLGQGTGVVHVAAPGSANGLFISNGASADPSFTAWSLAVPGTATKVMVSSGTNWVNSAFTLASPGASGQPLVSDGTNWTSGGAPIGAAYGGTGQSSLTTHALLLGNGASGVNIVAAAAAGKVLLGNGVSADPVFSAFTMASPGASTNVLTSDGTNWTAAPPTLAKTASGNSAGAGTIGTSITAVSTGVTFTLAAGQKVWVTLTLELSNNTLSAEIITYGFGTSTASFLDSYVHTVPVAGGGGPLATTYQTVHMRSGYSPGAGTYTLEGLAQASIAANIVPVKCLLTVEVVSV